MSSLKLPGASWPVRARHLRYAVLVGAMMMTRTVSAHPHAWIDVRSTVVVSHTGMATAIEEEWLFDELYTSYVVEETAGDEQATANSAAKFAGKAVENLKPFGYFMKIRSDGRQVSIGPIEQYHSEMRGDRLAFQFTAPLTENIDPVRHDFEFSVYDPTYFIEMTHDPEHPPRIKGTLPAPCGIEIHKATPSVEAVTRAFMMDRGAKPDDTLGELFAEKVALVCH